MASENVLKQKEEEVKKLAEKLKEAKVILLTDYRGINVADVTKLRTDLRNANSEYKVIKNNIIKRAIRSRSKETRFAKSRCLKSPREKKRTTKSIS